MSGQLESDCEFHVSNFTTFREILSLVVPGNSSAWGERSVAWYTFFYLLLIIFCILFVGLAIVGTFLLFHRHIAQRFRVKTFIAIDLALIVMGVSRFIFLILDPWGQLGFCKHPACLIISRLLGALAFPSITASYTLVFITLWLTAKLRVGNSWIQRLKILIPICCIHYGVAILLEIIAALPLNNSVGILVMLLVCEALFSLVGFAVCFSFLFAGQRLMKTVRDSARSSSVICRDSPNMNRHQLIEQAKNQNGGSYPRDKMMQRSKRNVSSQQKKSLRKVTLITYITVTLGMLYSAFRIVNITLILFSIYGGCPGMIRGAQQIPAVWLIFRYIFFSLEVSMGILLTYAISDYTPVINLFTKCFDHCSRCSTRCSRDKPAVVDNVIDGSPKTSTFATFQSYSITPPPPTGSSPTASALHSPKSPRSPRSASPLTVSFNLHLPPQGPPEIPSTCHSLPVPNE